MKCHNISPCLFVVVFFVVVVVVVFLLLFFLLLFFFFFFFFFFCCFLFLRGLQSCKALETSHFFLENSLYNFMGNETTCSTNQMARKPMNVSKN